MFREFTCIICPNGCDITAEYEIREDGTASVLSVSGQTCSRGEEYVLMELSDPRRTIATSVAVRGGEMPLVSVRLTKPVPKKDIFRVMEEIRKITLEAPVEAGSVVISRVLGHDSDVITTGTVERASCEYSRP